MSFHLPVLVELIRVARKAVWTKDALVKKEVSRRVRAQREKKQFLKLYQATENKLVSSLQSFFQEQVQSATKQMERLVGDDLSAKEMASKIYKPTDWNLPLANATFPVLVNDISKAALLQLSSMGYVLPSQQKSTASDWLESHGVPIPDSIITDMPDWMVEKIEDLCETSFSQEFWDDVSKTTLDDLERVVSKGLTEGLSIPKLAKQIKSTLNDEYYHNRSVNIARTEAGSALNGARRAAIDGLMEEIGDQLPMKVVWLSVLGTTTREEHAHLDGVPADENGRWELAGKSIPWPGHWNLPPSQRCNCQCTILVEYGMEEAEAKQLIADYSMRVAKKPGGKTLRQLVEKYRPAQPRVPADSPQGGQWTDGGGGSGGGDLGDLPDDIGGIDDLPDDLGSVEDLPDDLGGSSSSSFVDSLSEQEKKAITQYTTGAYALLNERLRKCPDTLGCLSAPQMTLHKRLESALKKRESYDPPKKLYRGISLFPHEAGLLLEQLKKSVGKKLSFPGVTSFTEDAEVATEFATGGSLKKQGFMFSVKAKTGASIEAMSKYPHEKEVIHPHNTKYKVAGVRKENGRTIVDLEEV